MHGAPGREEKICEFTRVRARMRLQFLRIILSSRGDRPKVILNYYQFSAGRRLQRQFRMSG
jgi:hypothetical protein